MVVFETTLATSALKLDGEMKVLGPLTRFTIYLLGLYMALKIGDMVVRGTYVYLLDGTNYYGGQDYGESNMRMDLYINIDGGNLTYMSKNGSVDEAWHDFA